MVRKRRKYTKQFKVGAVRLSKESGESFADLARRLGIHRNLLYKWRKQFQQHGDEAFPGQGKLRASDEEVRKLRRELARTRRERDILKKAIAFFAKEGR